MSCSVYPVTKLECRTACSHSPAFLLPEPVGWQHDIDRLRSCAWIWHDGVTNAGNYPRKDFTVKREGLRPKNCTSKCRPSYVHRILTSLISNLLEASSEWNGLRKDCVVCAFLGMKTFSVPRKLADIESLDPWHRGCISLLYLAYHLLCAKNKKCNLMLT